MQGGDGDLFLTLEFEPMPSESIPDAMDGGSTEASTEAFSIHEPHQDETQEKEEEQEEADDTAGRLARALRAHGLPLSVSRGALWREAYGESYESLLGELAAEMAARFEALDLTLTLIGGPF